MFPVKQLQIRLTERMGKRRFVVDPDCVHEEYEKERPIFGGQKSGALQCMRCGLTRNPNNPPQIFKDKT